MSTWHVRLRNAVLAVLLAVLVQAPVIMLLAGILPGVKVGGFWGAVLLALVAEVVFALAFPLILRLAFHFHPILFLIVAFGATVVAFRVAVFIVEIVDFDVDVSGFGTILIVIGVLLVVQALASSFLTYADDFGYYKAIRSGLASRHRRNHIKSAEPGVIYLEIDGLARPILEEALAAGWMPNLKSWLEDDGYVVSEWEPDLSSQTSASQAGILLGANQDIPAFRWWDKATGQPMVSSSAHVATLLEERLTTGAGLLVGGAGRWNVFTGDAQDAVATFSNARESGLRPTIAAAMFLSNPLTLARNVGLFLAELVRERWQAWQQVRHNVQPRLHRTIEYAFVRAATNASMQEMSIFMLTSDILRGIPVVYNTFFAYDEVAHHSGPRSSDAFKVLTTLDAGFGELRKATDIAPRPYHLVVLSDHGQSAGATFKQRFGYSLEDLVRTAVDQPHRVESFEGQSESMANASAAVGVLVDNTGWVGDQVSKHTPVGRLEISGSTRREETAGSMQQTGSHDIIVMASGNLGVIYFTNVPHRVTLEALETELPGLIAALVAHPGVSFIMVRAEADDEAVVIGQRGRHYLKADRVEGDGPLGTFRPTSRDHLLRTDGFTNAPDILVMSMFDPATGETAAFEELIGNHGGLGGEQQQPFVFHPSSLEFPATPVVGAAAVHQVLKAWVPEDANTHPDRGLGR